MRFSVETTKPEHLKRHDISDEQLEMLGATNHDGISEAFWGCLGAGLAALLAVADSWYDAYFTSPHQPVSPLHAIESIVAIAGLVAALTLRVGLWGRRKRAQDIIKEIRARPTTVIEVGPPE